MKHQVVPTGNTPGSWVRAVVVAGATAFAVMAGPAHAAGNAAAGQRKSFDCEGCHLEPGYRITYPRLYDVPKLGGQHATYIIAALHEYQQKQRSSKTMQAIAAGLSQQDIENLAAYFSGKGGDNAAPAKAAPQQ
ncbi:MAG TPA: hypothetical protein VFN52_01000 [Acidiferrobacteraceae bacterium]|nr:hypothetical protein [Acidiferrobacteraceae bacterium]